MFSDLKIVTGSSNPELAKAICDHLGCQLTPTLSTTFSDGELRIEIGDNVRGDDVFVVQPTCPPNVNRNLVQLCLMLDALKRASAGRITAVIPYYGYARQDRKTRGREPISAKLVANLLVEAGASRVLTLDLHAEARHLIGFLGQTGDDSAWPGEIAPSAPASAPDSGQTQSGG